MHCTKCKKSHKIQVSRTPSETSVKYGFSQPGFNKIYGCSTTLDVDLILSYVQVGREIRKYCLNSKRAFPRTDN